MAGLAITASGLAAEDRAADVNARLGRGINLGNALEAPEIGAWGMELEESYFDEIAQAGFDSVRIPIRWSAHAARSAPYAIDPGFFKHVDWAIDQALSRGLLAVVNFHHIEELYADPEGERGRFLALWRQVAERYQDRPDGLVFEILNEPHGNLGVEPWNDLIPEALAVIRESNPDRVVIVGPAPWNGFRGLADLKLPEGDRNLIATFHYYEPFPFTHQGASWVEGSGDWLGTTWEATEEQRSAVAEAFDQVASWADRHGRPVYLGEFGAYSRADEASRQRWTAFVAREAERRGFSWAYWEFGSGFGAFDRQSGRWREGLLRALVPDSARLRSR
ncbi:glycoside hydrolase family 5 protein [Tautonia sociabilis]|uniref:Glycoside hydrolase family 5 protein n=2 Tax=Tautonia sociabilis TaxID=2080755 RepID=A0A432MS41_9BACT|nr:glycoside hydrolase family 5 protein [Tautonia sociabilis]